MVNRVTQVTDHVKASKDRRCFCGMKWDEMLEIIEDETKALEKCRKALDKEIAERHNGRIPRASK